MTIRWFLNSEQVKAGITLRDVTVKGENNMALKASENSELVLNNRHRLAKHLQVPLSHFVFANQDHTNKFHKVTKFDAGKGAIHTKDAIDRVDALYTYERGLVLTCFTADCVPLIFY